MIDKNTKKNIADVLWLDGYDETKLPKSIKDAINSPRNSNSAFGERIRNYMEWLRDNQLSHNPDYTKRYNTLIEDIGDLSAQQAYIASTFFCWQQRHPRISANAGIS